jgi:hypothetical protein
MIRWSTSSAVASADREDGGGDPFRSGRFPRRDRAGCRRMDGDVGLTGAMQGLGSARLGIGISTSLMNAIGALPPFTGTGGKDPFPPGEAIRGPARPSITFDPSERLKRTLRRQTGTRVGMLGSPTTAAQPRRSLRLRRRTAPPTFWFKGMVSNGAFALLSLRSSGRGHSVIETEPREKRRDRRAGSDPRAATCQSRPPMAATRLRRERDRQLARAAHGAFRPRGVTG